MKVENFTSNISEEQILFIQIVHLDKSAYVYVGDEDQKMSNAYIGIQTKFVKILI